ncbi:hypothetical protein ANANG_G00318840 [Anguilla anguilla]|uniref:Uncharacterized protein n=1 Tax=Anguilla anguilla TaxID=7936 RepID=A0A9D3LHV6_ANGAN|nr:hypothetical protein ANANG_G00318840 [Anguilla anguilla]
MNIISSEEENHILMHSDAECPGAVSGVRVRPKKRAAVAEPASAENQLTRSSGRQANVRVKRCSNSPGQTKRKATDTEEDEDQSEKKYRKCEKAGCSATYPVCFASASERCAKNGYTSRWYHLSCGEHFCNECFDHYYRRYSRLWTYYSIVNSHDMAK